MAFVIIKTFLKRVQKLKRVEIKQEIFDEMIQYRLVRDMLQLNAHVLAQAERLPISQIPDYVEKFSNERQYNQDQVRYAGSVTPRPFFAHVHYP